MSREQVESVVGSTFETGGEHATEKKVVVRVDCHLILVLPEVMDGINHSGIVFEARIAICELLQEAAKSDLFRKW